ncbi:MAG: hypothetical protein ABI356_09565 [Steroidobacteraceae bacterium]
MKFTIQLLIENADSLPLSISLETIERPCDAVEDVGLRLEETKAILRRLQDEVVRSQLARHLERHRACFHCNRLRGIKGYHSLSLRTAFGDIAVRSPRWNRCACEAASAKTSFSPLNALLTAHTTPELEYLQAKWAAHLSFSAVANLLQEIIKQLQRVKWFLWHGNVMQADDTLSALIDDVDGARAEDGKAARPTMLVLKKLSRALEEFGAYIQNNASGIVNYGERYRCGERISTGLVESTIKCGSTC